jgi:hypothetical protein
MQSTGKEKFTVYVYYKTKKYEPDHPWSESSSEEGDLSSSEANASDDENPECSKSEDEKMDDKHHAKHND